MDIQQLEYYVILADLKSFSRTAEQLFISRQGLSKSISSLEQELGKTLIIRSNGGVKLTESGIIVRRYAAKLLEDYHTMQSALKEPEELKHPEIRVAMQMGFWQNIQDMVDSFISTHPEIRCTSSSFYDGELAQRFGQGDFDFAITTDSTHYPQYDYHLLYRNYRCIKVPKNHPLAKLPAISTKDLENETVAVADSNYYDYFWFQRICNKANVHPQISVIHDTLTIYNYAEKGKMPTLLIGDIRNERPDTGNCKAMFWNEAELAESIIDVNIITKKDGDLPADVWKLIQHMQRCCREFKKKANYYPFCSNIAQSGD